MSILVVGLNPAYDLSLRLDSVIWGKVNRPKSEQLLPAGKGINVARFVKELGEDSCLSGFLGKENQKGFLFELTKKGIENQTLSVEGAIRINLKILEDSGQTTDFNGLGSLSLSNAEEAFLTHFKNQLSKRRIVVLTGSLPQGFPEDYYQLLISLAKNAGCFVILDTSNQALKCALKASPDLIKPNEHELSELISSPVQSIQEAKKAALRLQKEYQIPNVVVSMGEKGAVYLLKDKAYHCQNRVPLKVQSTVGAGDSLVAALVVGLSQNFEHEALVRFATSVSAGCVTCLGPKLPKHSELRSIESQLSFETLS